MAFFVQTCEIGNDEKENRNPSSFSQYEKFIYALRAKESKRQYPKRLQKFLDFINIKSASTEENCILFYEHISREHGRSWLENELIKFFTIQNQRAEKGEISTETIKNYFKPIKLFCEMNSIIINWKIISKGIKRGNRSSNDRPPSKDEIKKLLIYPDRRIKPIVLIMISSGIRVGSTSYLKWGYITPYEENSLVIAAKIRVFNGCSNYI